MRNFENEESSAQVFRVQLGEKRKWTEIISEENYLDQNPKKRKLNVVCDPPEPRLHHQTEIIEVDDDELTSPLDQTEIIEVDDELTSQPLTSPPLSTPGNTEGNTRKKKWYNVAIRKVGSWSNQFRQGSNPLMARYVYSFIFLVVSVIAWFFRDYGHTTLPLMERLNGCKTLKVCVGAEGALRLSLGCFIFFSMMCVSTIGTSKMHQRKEVWHSGKWIAKVLILLSIVLVVIFMPSLVIVIYGTCARFGAGIFLLVQLVSMKSSILWLNSLFGRYVDTYRIHMMVLAAALHIASSIGIILMYVWYTPNVSCGLNIFFVSFTLLLLVLMICVSTHPSVNSCFLTPALMGLYVVYLGWSAITSEPPQEKCLGETKSTNGDWLTIVSFVVGVITMVIETFFTGEDSKLFQFWEDEKEKEEDDVPYSFGFFHFVFATGAMYFVMLLVDWSSHHPIQKFSIGIGWASTWVKISCQWLMVLIYICILLVPVLRRSKRRVESQV